MHSVLIYPEHFRQTVTFAVEIILLVLEVAVELALTAFNLFLLQTLSVFFKIGCLTGCSIMFEKF